MARTSGPLEPTRGVVSMTNGAVGGFGSMIGGTSCSSSMARVVALAIDVTVLVPLEGEEGMAEDVFGAIGLMAPNRTKRMIRTKGPLMK